MKETCKKAAPYLITIAATLCAGFLLTAFLLRPQPQQIGTVDLGTVADGTTLSRLEATDHLDWYNSMMALRYTGKDMEEQARRSIAMYKSVELSNRQNVKMTLVEGLSAGLIGAVIAIFVSYREIQTIFLVAGPKIEMPPAAWGSSLP